MKWHSQSTGWLFYVLLMPKFDRHSASCLPETIFISEWREDEQVKERTWNVAWDDHQLRRKRRCRFSSGTHTGAENENIKGAWGVVVIWGEGNVRRLLCSLDPNFLSSIPDPPGGFTCALSKRRKGAVLTSFKTTRCSQSKSRSILAFEFLLSNVSS